MKYTNEYTLVFLPDSELYAQNSISVQLNTDVMRSHCHRSIPTGSSVTAHQIAFDDLEEGKEYIVLGHRDNISIGVLVKHVRCGLTLQPNNPTYPGLFLHKVNIKAVYLVTAINIPR